MRAAVPIVRPYRAGDEAAALALWRRTWQQAYPQVDFAARADWWKRRWREELLRTAEVVVCELEGELVGFVTVERPTGYLDQIVVAPDRWGAGIGALLLDEAKRISPEDLRLDVNQDNHRAIAFYRKNGFAITESATNPNSGAPTYTMHWRSDAM